MVVPAGQTNVDADVQESVGAEREAVEAVEALGRRVDNLLLGELAAGPTAPGLQLELDARAAARLAPYLQGALLPSQAPDEVRRALELGRGAALEQKHPAVRA